MRIPAIEALFPAPWPAPARRVLPSPSPEFTATAMWGPVLAWSVLQLLAESIDVDHPEHVALDLFDRLRLREPFAQSFAALGFEGEEGWRVVARIKVVLLTGAGIGSQAPSVLSSEPHPATAVSPAAEKPDPSPASRVAEEPDSIPASPAAAESNPSPASPVAEERDSSPALYQGTTSVVPQSDQNKRGALAPEESSSGVQPLTSSTDQPTSQPIITPALWSDPDVRWLTGAHRAEGHDYFLRESYEELLWWLLLPSLLRIAADATPARTAIAQMSSTIQEALSAAQAAKYRIDVLIAPPPAPHPVAPPKEAPINKKTPAPTAPKIQSETVDPK
jgi:hypothetical protein